MISKSRRPRTPALASSTCLLVAVSALLMACDNGRKETAASLSFAMEADECWWVGVISQSHVMPLQASSEPYTVDLYGDTHGNQVQPLLVSSNGRYVWSEEPFRIEIREGTISLAGEQGTLHEGRAGTTLRGAALGAAQRFFPPSGRIPDEALFTHPQFNTWIELTYDQNQADILAYAHGIVENGFTPGVLMIDEGWFEEYGRYVFHPGRFPDPKGMMDELHGLGFEIMLWVCPYVRPDGQYFKELFLNEDEVVWLRSAENPRWPAIMQWWDGFSAVTDLTSPYGREWFTGQLDRLVEEYGVDGFKLDGGDAQHYSEERMLQGAVAHDADASPNEQARAFAEIGLDYPLNEYRACWKMGGQPLAQRLRDKRHRWEDLRTLIPGIVNQGLMGYPFNCPDMIGGGEYLSFRDLAAVDQELIVRAAQTHALMPMMQFSVAPWRVLSPENLAVCRRAAALHSEMGAEILALAREASRTGEPIVRSLEYQYPHAGYADIDDQFLLGPSILVAPVLENGARSRPIVFPPGRWRGDDDSTVEGPTTLEIDAPLDRLPWYRRIDAEPEP